jgi:hypothetical protein
LDYKKNNKKSEYSDIVELVNVEMHIDWLDNMKDTDTSKNELMLVNRVYGLSEDFVPEDLVDVPTGTPLDYTVAIEIETEEADVQLDAVITFGNEQQTIYTVDNSKSFPATSGAVFYINDEEGARITLGDMRFTPDGVVSHLSECMTLRIGDLIFLGSGTEFEVKAGDNYKVVIAGKTMLNFDIK